MLSFLSILAVAAATAQAHSPRSTALEPLSSKHVTWGDIPYQISGENAGPRGPQFGFNLCNSTTQNQDSDCQTMVVNSAIDFCMWSSPKTNDNISYSEAYEVAWCTKTGYGTRMIPEGSITGLQVLYAKNYIQYVGFINQVNINLQADDQGGELDPHGDDEQGNPLGGLVFTNGFGMNSASFSELMSSGANYTANQNFTQVEEWVDFVGSGQFCMKICNPDSSEAPELCAHIYDEIGCGYNTPNQAQNGTFEVCDSDDMTPVGVYTVDGTPTTWVQPFTGAVNPPYTPVIPASSNCKTYSSEQLFQTALATTSSPSSTATGTGPTGKTGSSGSSGATGSRTSGSSSASNTSGSSAAGRSVASMPFYALAGVISVAFIGPVFFL